jgi:haloacid dehalogenase superfamily, subfamily IA, variant 3 with third motif having DD or ED
MTTGLDIRAIIFDLDGLVLDSEAGYFAAWRQAGDTLGYAFNPELCASLSGLHGSEISQRLLAHFGDQFPLKTFYQLSTDIWHQQVRQQGIPVRKGFYAVLECITALQLPYCLATNSSRADALKGLAYAGLEGVFTTLVTREDVRNPKPAADIFLKAAKILQKAPANCLVLEDSPVGIRAAVAAGCPSIFAPSISPEDPFASMMANRVFADLDAVADFISGHFQ